MSVERPARLVRGLAFAGSVYPISLLTFVLMRGRLPRARRADWPWLGSVLAYLALSVVHGSLDSNVLGVALAWLVYRSGAQLGGASTTTRALGVGFAAGTACIAVFAAAEVLAFGRPRAEGLPWFGQPNILGHAMLLIGFGLAALTTSGKARWLAVFASFVVVVLAGSRSTFVGLLVCLAIGAYREKRRRVPFALATSAVIALLIAATVLMPTSPWVQRVLGPFVGIGAGTSSVNMLVASEALSNPAAWSPGGVTVRSARRVDAGAPVVHTLEREANTDWARPQQLVTLEPHGAYTFSGEFETLSRAEPGFLAWATTHGGTVELRVAIRAHEAIVHASRGFVGTRARVAPLDDGWVRLEVTTRLGGADAVALAFGPSPDLASADAGAVAHVRALQVESGTTASRYHPTTRIRTGAGEAMARIPIWLTAMAGVRERPLAGWGQRAFPTFFAERTPLPAGSDIPTHPHNQVLASAFDGGAIGVVAVALLIWGLVRPARDWVRAVLLGVLAANLFDATLLTGIVLLPAAFLGGLGSIVHVPRSRTGGATIG